MDRRTWFWPCGHYIVWHGKINNIQDQYQVKAKLKAVFSTLFLSIIQFNTVAQSCALKSEPHKLMYCKISSEIFSVFIITSLISLLYMVIIYSKGPCLWFGHQGDFQSIWLVAGGSWMASAWSNQMYLFWPFKRLKICHQSHPCAIIND